MPFQPMQLLYPIYEKDYDKDPYIVDSWRCIRYYLKRAYMLTIFGYSAPISDQSAIELLKSAWGKVEDRSLEEIEIIDIKKEANLIKTWDEFIYTHHYSIHTDFFDSSLGRFPRRSCEATFDRLMNGIWLDGTKGFKSNMSFAEINTMLKPLIEDEMNDKKTLANPYV